MALAFHPWTGGSSFCHAQSTITDTLSSLLMISIAAFHHTNPCIRIAAPDTPTNRIRLRPRQF